MNDTATIQPGDRFRRAGAVHDNVRYNWHQTLHKDDVERPARTYTVVHVRTDHRPNAFCMIDPPLADGSDSGYYDCAYLLRQERLPRK